MKLFQINREYEEILNDLHDDQGEINPLALAKLNQNELELKQKIIAVASYLKNIEAEKDAIENAKKAMQEREKRFKKRIDSLSEYLQSNMQARSITSIGCPYFEIKLKKCPPSVNIIDERALPDEYLRTKTETSPDKGKILADMKVGVIVPGAAIQQNMRLEIK